MTSLKLQAAHAEFEEAKVALDSHRTEFQSVFSTHNQLAAAYNEALANVKALYAKDESAGKHLGDFKKREKRAIDAANLRALLDIYGVDPAEIEKVVTTKYVSLKEQYDDGVAAGIVTPEIQEQVESYTTEIAGPAQAAVLK